MGSSRYHCIAISIALLFQLGTPGCSAAALTMSFPRIWLPWLLGQQAKTTSLLSDHDVVLIIDKSYSMAKRDCPPGDSLATTTSEQATRKVSRWEWCHQQTLDLTHKTGSSIANGIKVILFARHYQVFPQSDPKKIEKIFADHTPHGATKAAIVLKAQLDEYFERRGQARFHTKPLLIAVITDGCPDEPYKLRETIVDATRKMIDPAEISIAFLQVGNDGNGTRILNQLDSQLVTEQARYDIVSVTPFSELQKEGLTQALMAEVASR